MSPFDSRRLGRVTASSLAVGYRNQAPGFDPKSGEAAHEQGFQAIRSRSATGVDDVLAVFVEKVGAAVIGVDLIVEWMEVGDLA